MLYIKAKAITATLKKQILSKFLVTNTITASKEIVNEIEANNRYIVSGLILLQNVHRNTAAHWSHGFLNPFDPISLVIIYFFFFPPRPAFAPTFPNASSADLLPRPRPRPRPFGTTSSSSLSLLSSIGSGSAFFPRPVYIKK